MVLERLEVPQRARPAFVAWQAGVGRQEFANDPVLTAALERKQRAARRTGQVRVRRIPATTFAAAAA